MPDALHLSITLPPPERLAEALGPRKLKPADRERTKVWYACTRCGDELLKRDVTEIWMGHGASKRVLDLVHHTRTGDGWCGPVQFAENPTFRKQRG